jgi:hypothetical protein
MAPALEVLMAAKGRKPRKSDHKAERIGTIWGRPEWKKWVQDFAVFNRCDVGTLVDQALTRLARELEFREPPER